ncbi:hypothetical protein ACTXT7_015771 [Hymenolepis weldensis]
MSHAVSNTSSKAVTLKSSTNSTQPPIVPVNPKVLPTVSKVVGQDADKAALPHCQNLMCPQTDVPRSYIDLTLAKQIRGISYLIHIGLLLWSKYPPLHPLPNLNGQDEKLVDNASDDALCWCLSQGGSSQTSPFPVHNCIFLTEDGSSEDLSGRILPPSAVASQNSDDPVRSSARPLLRAPQKTSEKIQGGSNAQAYG